MKLANQLLVSYSVDLCEAGCDEAGRGCLAGPVFAAAVITGKDFNCPGLNDSKKLSVAERKIFRDYIENHALAWAVASVDHTTIDKINILQASLLAMHKAISKLKPVPGLLLIDGNRFLPYPQIPHQCFVKGDARFVSIAAASILAKTHRDAFMENLHDEFPHYGWVRNKGYPTAEHVSAIEKYGYSPYHRMSFKIKSKRQFQNQNQFAFSS